jgi:uncharacterized SAM-binding protein YcdF (DUF218 family)
LRWTVMTRWLSVAAALLLVVAGILPLGTFLTRALENRYPRPAWPAKVDGILVLSGGMDGAMLHARGVMAGYGGQPRLIAAQEAALRYPQARVVFAGGSGLLSGTPYSEAGAARHVFAQMGLDLSRLTLEERSRNTYENILLSKEIARPRPNEIWLLATSAINMPRAMEIARRLNWRVVPWPTDYLTQPQGLAASFDIASNIGGTDYAVHEWIGIWAYRFTGKSTRS